jgi:hypothetical protein
MEGEKVRKERDKDRGGGREGERNVEERREEGKVGRRDRQRQTERLLH